MEAYVALAAGCVVYVGLTLRSIERRQAAIEYRLLALSRHLGIVAEAGSEPSEHVKRLASDPRTYIEALRAYRTETDADLKQARRVIDPLRPRARSAGLFQ
jgi:hypothetical protein